MHVLTALGLCALTPSAERAGAAPARLGGTFLQLTAAHNRWTGQQWRELFDHLEALDVTDVVVQWTSYDDTVFYSRENGKLSGALGTILELADRSGMQVFVGLPEDSQYWARIAEAPSAVTVYLRRLALRQQDVAESLAPSLNEHRSVVGWYIPQEIDDVNWNDAERRAILSRHLQQLTATLRRAAPERRIAISGFSNAHLAPRGLAAFWRELVTDAGLDALFFQDGIGAGKLQLEELEAYLPPLQEMCDNSRCELRMIVELFQSAEGGRFEPAAIDRIGRQLQLAAAMTRRPPLAFSIPDYMLPAGGPAAGRLLRAYSERLR